MPDYHNGGFRFFRYVITVLDTHRLYYGGWSGRASFCSPEIEAMMVPLDRQYNIANVLTMYDKEIAGGRTTLVRAKEKYMAQVGYTATTTTASGEVEVVTDGHFATVVPPTAKLEASGEEASNG